MNDEPRYKIARSFTRFHQCLLEIAFGRSKPKITEEMYNVDFSRLGQADLLKLARMVKVEFAASLTKSMESPVVHATGNPHVFDVFLMKSSPGRSRTSLKLAACLPVMVKKESILMWHDAEGSFWPLEPKSHIRRVASLSGAARILEALSSPPSRLMLDAMKRENIIHAMDDNAIVQLDEEIYMSGMNKSQRSAVATIASGRFRDGFLVIQGPPGCGKTTTMVGMISAIGRGAIVLAPSNAAVANVALKLYATGRYELTEISVYGSNCAQSVHFLNPIHRSKQFQSFCQRYHDAKDNSSKELAKKEFASWIHVNVCDYTMEDMAALCPYIDMEDGAGHGLLKEIVSSSSVIMCTLNTAGSSFIREVTQGGFETVLLDEGGQCSEAEFYIATTIPGIRRIVVVGDPRQLPATVIDRNCQRGGYGESWMGHVAEAHPHRVHLLDTQYRMDPAILKFPNSCFYSNSILSGGNVFGREPDIECPYLFVDTMKRGKEEKKKRSFQNSHEAEVIKSLLKSDSDIARVRQSGGRIIIITPYKAQVVLLENTLNGVENFESLPIATVDSFQGQEASVVIVSTVRTKAVGFVDSAQRLNVALTRAQRVLRVVGDQQFFLSLSDGSTLKKLAEHMRGGETEYRKKTKKRMAKRKSGRRKGTSGSTKSINNA